MWKPIRFLARFALFLALLFGVAEVFFRVALPARETPFPWQDPVHTLQRYDPNGPKTGTFTSGRQIQQRATWHINAEGWNSPRPYLPADQRDKPLIAILGDSQIDGMYTDWAESLPRQLELLTGERYAVYGFGHSGYKLGQYITVAEYLKAKRFEPAIVVLSVNPGDVSGAVDQLGGRRRSNNTLLSIVSKPDAPIRFEEKPPTAYRTTTFRRLMRRSALVRYLVFNARINPFSGRQRDLALDRNAGRAEARARKDPRYAAAIRHVVRRVRGLLPNAKLVFLIDGDRYGLYETGTATPIDISPVITRVCAEEACEVLDMTATYTARFAADGRWFNFAHNPHWNAYGQRVIAAALFEKLTSKSRPPRKP